MPPPAFVPFGTDHLAALVATAALALALVALVRRRPAGRVAAAVRVGLAAGLVLATAAALLDVARTRPLTAWDLVPLHLCDFLILIALWALATRGRAACELLYFWTGAGTTLALVTPDVPVGFPDPRYLAFFALHAALVATAAVLTFGLGVRPGPGAVRRVFVLTNAYAAVVGAVDAAFGVNFLYLCAKPAVPTLLDWLGPWPYYLVTVDALALVLFLLLGLPFRRDLDPSAPRR